MIICINHYLYICISIYLSDIISQMHPNYPKHPAHNHRASKKKQEQSDDERPICTHGPSCKFQHSCKYRHPQLQEKPQKPVCTYGASCRFQHSCKYRHPQLQQKPQKPKTQQKKGNGKVCKFGLKCQSLIYEGHQCNYEHESKQIVAIECAHIADHQQTIVIYKDNAVRCLRNYQIPVVLEGETFLKPGYYYLAQFVSYAKKNTAIKMRIIERLCKFGEVQQQIKLLKKYFEPQNYYDFIQPGDQLQTGVVEVDRYGTYMIKSQKGKEFNIYFKDKKANGIFFLREGCIVTYSGTPLKYKVHSIQYKPFPFSGILQIDQYGQFYVQCRNAQHLQIRVANIPQIVQFRIYQISKYVPYTFMLRGLTVQPNKVKKINKILKDIFVKGKFIDRPIQSLFSIGVIDEETTYVDIETVNDAIYYQYNIDDDYSQNFNLQKQPKTVKSIKQLQTFQQQYIFTLDTQNAKLLQDALSVRYVKQGDVQYYKVGIHATDVDSFMPENSQADQLAKVQGMLTYVYGRIFDNVHLLRNKFSFQKGMHLAQSMTLNFDKNSLIDFSSIKFCNSFIAIQNNYNHSQNLKKLLQLEDLHNLSEKLEKFNYLDHMYLSSHMLRNNKYSFEMLMAMSYAIPTFMWEINSDKIICMKQKINSYINELMQNIKHFIKCNQKFISLPHTQANNQQNIPLKQKDSLSTFEKSSESESVQIQQAMQLLTIQDKKRQLENRKDSDKENLIYQIINKDPFLEENYKIEKHKKVKKQTQLQKKLNINKAMGAFKVLMRQVFYINKIDILWESLDQISFKFKMAINKQKGEQKKKKIIQLQRRNYFYFPYIIQNLSNKQKKELIEQVRQQKEEPTQMNILFQKGVQRAEQYKDEVFSLFSFETQQLLKQESIFDLNQDDLKGLSEEKQIECKKQFIEGIKYGISELLLRQLNLPEIEKFIEGKLNQIAQQISQNQNIKKNEQILSMGMEQFMRIKDEQQILVYSDEMSKAYIKSIYYKKLKQMAKEILEKQTKSNSQLDLKNNQAQMANQNKQILQTQKNIKKNQVMICNQQNQQTLEKLIQKNQHNISLLFSLEKILNQKYQNANKTQLKQANSTNQVYRNYISKVCQIVRQILKNANGKIQETSDSQFMKQLQKVVQQKDASIQYNVELNKKFQKFCLQHNKSDIVYLKWNNPVRSNASLVGLRLLKYYPWVFQGQLSVQDVLLNYQDIFTVNSKFKDIEDILEKEGKKKRKQQIISKEIMKNQLFYQIKNCKYPYKSTFSRTTRPDETGYSQKYVWHNTFGEVKIANPPNGFKNIKDRMQGSFVIVSQIPQVVEVILSY